MNRADLASRHCVEDGKKFKLKDVDPFDTAGLDVEKGEAKASFSVDQIQNQLEQTLSGMAQ